MSMPPPPGGPVPPPGWVPPPGPGATPPPPPWGAPAPAYGAWPTPPPVVGKQGSGCLKVGLIVAAVVIGGTILLGGCLALFGDQITETLGTRTGTADESDYDLTGPECIVNPALGPQASGRITNTSGRSQAFEVEVRFVSRTDGSLISSNIDIVDALDAGQSTTWKVTSLKDPPADGQVDCTVSEVRYSRFSN